MARNLRLLVCIIATLHNLPAFAQCELMPSTLSDFGSVALGDSRSKLPKDVSRSRNCFIDESMNFADCTFVDRRGVAYSVSGDAVFLKKIRIGELPAGVELPFLLKATDGIAQVVEKMEMLRDAPLLHIGYNVGDIVIYTGQCLINTLGVEFGIEIVFDRNGKLLSIAARTLTEGA